MARKLGDTAPDFPQGFALWKGLCGMASWKRAFGWRGLTRVRLSIDASVPGPRGTADIANGRTHAPHLPWMAGQPA